MKIISARIAAALPLLLLLAGGMAYADTDPEGFFNAYQISYPFQAGHTYTIETSNLRKRDLLQNLPPSTHLLVIDPDGIDESGTLIAHAGESNDRFESRVTFRAQVTKYYKIVMTSNNADVTLLSVPGDQRQCGNADLTIREVLSILRQDFGVPFCGDSHYIKHHADECFTANANANATRVDPYIFYFPSDGRSRIYDGVTVRWNDDTSGNNARICFEDEGTGWMLTTATTVASEGPGNVDLVEHTRVLTADGQNIDNNHMNVQTTSLIRRRVTLNANTPYIIETNNLAKRDLFQSTSPDTVLYVIDPITDTVVARNDDINPNEDRSQLVYVPPQTRTHELLVRAKYRSTPGKADLYVNGQPVATGSHFAGEALRPLLKRGLIDGQQDCVATSGSTGNPYFAWFLSSSGNADPGVGARVVEDDNGGVDDNAEVCFSDFSAYFSSSAVARGMLLLGSSTSAGEGTTLFFIRGSDHNRAHD